MRGIGIEAMLTEDNRSVADKQSAEKFSGSMLRNAKSDLAADNLSMGSDLRRANAFTDGSCMLSRVQGCGVCCQVGVIESLRCCQLLVLQGNAECLAAVCPHLLPAELCQHDAQLMHVAEVIIGTSIVQR